MSHKQFTPNDRYTINKLRDSGIVKAEIARILNFHASSVGREIARNTDPMFKGIYNHVLANNRVLPHIRAFLEITSKTDLS